MAGPGERVRRRVARLVAPVVRRLLPRSGGRAAAVLLTGARLLGNGEHGRMVLLQEAEDRSRSGQTDRARELLAVVGRRPARAGAPSTAVSGGPGHASVASLTGEVRAHLLCGDLDAALRLAESASRESPDSLARRDLWIATLDRLGLTDRALTLCVENAQARLARLRRRRGDDPPVTRHLTRDTRIFVSGYFYSGSSAVLAYLLGLPDAAKWTPAGEMRLIKFPGGLADLAERHAAAGRFRSQDLVDHYLHLTGRKLTFQPPGAYDRWDVVNRLARRLARRRAAARYLEVCFEEFLALAASDAASMSTVDVEERFRAYVRRALDAAATGSDAGYLLVDQAIPAWRLGVAHLAPPSIFLLVHRDPRDQFAEAREVLRQPGRREPDVARFARTYRSRREVVAREVPRMERDLGHRVLHVAFEDFVVDHEATADDLLARLDLPRPDPSRGRFDPAESRVNVGKHVDLLTASEAKVLTGAAPEHLSPHLDPPAGP